MRVVVDTNILFSALLFPHSLPARVLLYIARECELLLCGHILSELHHDSRTQTT